MTDYGWDYPPGVSESDLDTEEPEEPETCDECGGTGEVERQIGGDDNGWGAAAALADVPMVCGLCDGTGVL